MSSAVSRPAYAVPMSQHDALGCILAAVGGFVDTAGFVGLDGLFTAHVTGNLVIVGARIAAHHAEATPVAEATLVRLMALPVFALTVAATSLLVRRLKRYGRSVVPPLLLVEGALLAAFAVAAHHLYGGASNLREAHALLISGSFGVAAMSVQTVMMREALPRLAPTTVMTGNFTQAVLDLIRMVAGERPVPGKQSSRPVWLALTGFLAGSALGAYAMLHMGFYSLFWPACVVAAVGLARIKRNE